MARGVWGIEAGSRSLKAVRMARAGDAAQVLAYEIIDYDLPGGGDAGAREAAIQKALTELKAKHKMTGDAVIASIPGRSVFSRIIKLPPVEKKRIPEIVRYESHQQIPFPIDEVTWDFQPVTDNPAPGEEIEVAIFAVKQEIVAGHLAMFRMAGIELDDIQPAHLALHDFFVTDQKPEGVTVVVDVGAENTDLLVLDGDRFWPRNITTAGDHVTRALEKKFQIPLAEAEKLKRSVGTSKQAQRLFGVIQPVLRSLAGEIQRSLGYYRSQHEGTKFVRVVALGESFRLTGLVGFFQETLQYPVERLGAAKTLTFGPGVDAKAFQEQAGRFAVALGLGFQSLGLGRSRITLMPAQTVRARALRRKRPFATASAAILMVSTFVAYAAAQGRAHALQGRYEEHKGLPDVCEGLRQQYEAASNYGPLTQQYQDLGALAADPDLGLPRAVWLDIVSRVVEVLPLEVPTGGQVPIPQIWLKSLNVSPIDNPQAGEPGQPPKVLRAVLYGYMQAREEDKLSSNTRPYNDRVRRLQEPLSQMPGFVMPPTGVRRADGQQRTGEAGEVLVGVLDSSFNLLQRESRAGDPQSPPPGGGLFTPGTEAQENAYYFKLAWLVEPHQAPPP